MWKLANFIAQALAELGTKWFDKKRAIADGQIQIAVSRAEAEAQIQLTKATAEIEWERAMAVASERSWKDELWTIFFVVILTLSFVPGMEPYIKQGFENIAELPDWFGYAVMLAISAAFGKNIVTDFTSLKTNSKAKEAALNAIPTPQIDKRD